MKVMAMYAPHHTIILVDMQFNLPHKDTTKGKDATKKPIIQYRGIMGV